MLPFSASRLQIGDSNDTARSQRVVPVVVVAKVAHSAREDLNLVHRQLAIAVRVDLVDVQNELPVLLIVYRDDGDVRQGQCSRRQRVARCIELDRAEVAVVTALGTVGVHGEVGLQRPGAMG